ncbi:MAG: M20 family peptidase, partial [Halanaerobiales bacterium]
MVGIYSPYFREEEIMNFVYNWLQDKGLSVQYHRYQEKKITGFEGVNVVGSIKGREGGKTVLLNGHLDTVEICEGWERDPLAGEIVDNRLYGVG